MNHLSRSIVFVAEVLGTGILVFVGCAACVLNTSAVHQSLGFGLAIMISVQSFGHISGAHINPIITVAAAIMGNLPLSHVPLYIVAQIIGAFLGFGVLKGAVPAAKNNICSPNIPEGTTAGEAFLMEFTGSFILVLVTCAIWDKKNAAKGDSVPLRFGFTITGLALAVGGFTGGHFNPARSLAPAAINAFWENHWVYWIAPLLAGCLAPLIYKFFLSKKQDDNTDDMADRIRDVSQRH